MSLIYRILDNRLLSLITTFVFLIPAILLKIQFNYELMLGTVAPLALISLAFSVVYSAFIVEKAGIKDLIRVLIAPMALFATVLFLKNVDIQSVVVRGAIFFTVNVVFFNKEINKILA